MSLIIEPTLQGQGIKTRGLAGQDLSAKNLVTLHSTGKWYKADISDVKSSLILGITSGQIKENSRGDILLFGFIIKKEWNWKAGGVIYASNIPGKLTQVKSAADPTPEIGVAQASDVILFSPGRVRKKIVNIELVVHSDNPDGTYKVTNLYVEIVEGEPKLRVEYEV